MTDTVGLGLAFVLIVLPVVMFFAFVAWCFGAKNRGWVFLIPALIVLLFPQKVFAVVEPWGWVWCWTVAEWPQLSELTECPWADEREWPSWSELLGPPPWSQQ